MKVVHVLRASLTFLLIILGVVATNNVSAQLTVATASAVQQVTYLTGPGVSISNITRNCPNGASGTFDGSGTNLSLSEGVLLTSGQIADAITPNTSAGAGTDNFSAGDSDLNTLSGVTTFDACALEFDLVANCDTISIAYVFASEEYDEYVCAALNDAFGFFISGPGLPYQNIALIPGSATPVSINTVNNGSIGTWGAPGGGCVLSNSSYYVSNASGTTHEYDGMTTRLLAKTWVQPCSTYHIKLVVADGGDGIFDSGVFLEAGGIGCASAQISVNTAAVNGGNAIVEGCNDGVLYFQRAGDLSSPYTVNFTIGGGATNGVDYSTISNSVTFASGVDSIGIQLTPVDDGLFEGIETIFVIISDTVCGTIFADTAAILISDPPAANFQFTAGCLGSPVNFVNTSSFAAGPISTNQWTFGDGTNSNLQSPSHTYANPGNYTVKLVVTTPQGCKDSITQQVTVTELPSPNFSYSGHCEQNLTQFTDLSTPGSGATLSSWLVNFGDGATSTLPNPSHIYANSGTYNVQYQVTNSNGCVDNIVLPVTIYDLPEVAFTSTVVCHETATQFTDQTVVPGGSSTGWTWDFGDGSNSVSQSPSHVFGGPGVFQTQLIVVSDQGCRDSLTNQVLVNPNPVAEFTSTVTCINDTTRFTDASSIVSGNIVSYSWDFGDGNSTSVQNPIHVYANVGLFPVTLTVVSDQGCSSSVTYMAEVTPGPVIPIAVPDTVCQGDEAILRVIVPNGINVRWYHDRTDPLPFHQGNTLPLGPVGQTQLFFVQAVTAKGCTSVLVPIWVKVWNPINVDIRTSDRNLEIPNAVVEFNIDNPAGINTIFWDFGDGSTSGTTNPVHQYTEPGIYSVIVSIIDEHGCERIYNFNEWIKVGINVGLFIPNAFSPNGDGINDEFFVGTRLITSLEVQIYDRWGKLMFKSQDMNFQWLGLDAAGENAPEGVYAYRIRAVSYTGETLDRSGTITLIR